MMSNCAFRVALCACAMCTFASVQILYSAEYIRVASPSVRIGEPWPCVIAIGYHENINKQSDWRMCERGSSSIGAAIVAPLCRSSECMYDCTMCLCVNEAKPQNDARMLLYGGQPRCVWKLQEGIAGKPYSPWPICQ